MKKDLHVTVIDSTKQEFNGEVFYLCGFYFQRNGKRLHRTVWEYYNGTIPKGSHIHHIDGNRSNNNIENLSCISASEHQSSHLNSPERIEISKIAIKRVRPKAAEWHKSADGIAWHSEQGRKIWKMRKPYTYICTQCGKEFQTKHIYSEGSNRFCCQNCKAKYGREHSKK